MQPSEIHLPPAEELPCDFRLPTDDPEGPDEHPTIEDVDYLIGAAAIARCLYGDATQRRKVYYRVERGEIPHIRIGGTIWTTRSALKRMVDRNLMRAVRALEAA